MHQASMFFSILSFSVFVGCLETEEKNATGEPSSTDPELSRPIAPVSSPNAPVIGRSEPHCTAALPNLVVNGAFESKPIHACGWESFDAADWGFIAAPYCADPLHSSCAIYLSAKVWGDPWVAQFYQRLALKSGEQYLLTFEAKAAGVDRPLVVAALNAGPLNGLGSGVEINLDTDWHSFAFPFTAGPRAEEAVLDFAVGSADTGLYLDNVTIIAVPPPPQPDAGLNDGR